MAEASLATLYIKKNKKPPHTQYLGFRLAQKQRRQKTPTNDNGSSSRMCSDISTTETERHLDRRNH